VNPFRFGEVVGEKTFCARPELVAVLKDIFLAGHKSVVLGERRTGKTSLILETARKIPGLQVIYAQLWAVDTLSDLVNRILQGVTTMTRKRKTSTLERAARALGQLRPVIEWDPETGSPSLTVGRNEPLQPNGLHGLFDFLEELSGEMKLVIVLDEFQDIRRLDQADAILGEMRGRIQRQGSLPYVFAGSIRHEMERIFRNPSSPFFKSFRTVEVGPIERPAFRKFLAARFATGQRRIQEATWLELFQLAHDIPSVVQQLCAAFWDRSCAGVEIEPGFLDTALRHIFATERKGYEFLVRPLTASQKRCLSALAKLGGAHPTARPFLEAAGFSQPSSAQRALQRLVYGPELNYKFFDPFFREWVRREFGRMP
jgi:hypothetical protein